MNTPFSRPLTDNQKDDASVTSAAELLMARTEATATNPPLYDVQGYADKRGVALKQAGVKAVQMPLVIQGQQNESQTVAATTTMSVALDAEHKGTHMSRFVIQLAEWAKPDKPPINLHLGDYLKDMASRLQSHSAQIAIGFKYFVDRPAPVSDMQAPMAYDVQYLASVAHHDVAVTMGVEVPIATVCPCSKAISRYGAHNQRVMVKVWVNMDNEAALLPVPLIQAIEACSSCPVYPLLKRQDEKYVTERGYENAKFVEDVAREITLLLRDTSGVTGFRLEVEALESIHAHNAWTCHEEQFVQP